MKNCTICMESFSDDIRFLNHMMEKHGFRNPNVDDVGKVFSKDDNHVVVPNNQLLPEKTLGLDILIAKHFKNKLDVKLLLFQTYLKDAIERGEIIFNGTDASSTDAGDEILIEDGTYQAVLNTITVNPNLGWSGTAATGGLTFDNGFIDFSQDRIIAV